MGMGLAECWMGKRLCLRISKFLRSRTRFIVAMVVIDHNFVVPQYSLGLVCLLYSIVLMAQVFYLRYHVAVFHVVVANIIATRVFILRFKVNSKFYSFLTSETTSTISNIESIESTITFEFSTNHFYLNFSKVIK